LTNKEETRTKKAIFGVMLAMVLAFGMTFVGCDIIDPPKDDYVPYVRPDPYLSGSVKLNNYYPVISSEKTITESNKKYSFSSDPIGIPSWKWYKTKEDKYSLSSVTNKTTLYGSGNTYTVSSIDVGFWIWAEVSYSGNSGTCSTRTYSTVLSDPRLPLGSVRFDKNYPVVGETITASFEKISSGSVPDPIGTPSWRWYKTQEDASYLSDVTNKTSLGSGTTYIVKQNDQGFWIWAEVSYSGNSGTEAARTYSTVIGIPATATVSVSVEAMRYLSSPGLFSGNHKVTVTLALSDGRWNNVSYSTASQWLTITGQPSISSWTGLLTGPSVSAQGRKLVFTYQNDSDTILPINLKKKKKNDQLSTMLSNTNVYNTLTAGTPSSASVSQWTIRD
jgi:hypothetical protein